MELPSGRYTVERLWSKQERTFNNTSEIYPSSRRRSSIMTYVSIMPLTKQQIRITGGVGDAEASALWLWLPHVALASSPVRWYFVYRWSVGIREGGREGRKESNGHTHDMTRRSEGEIFLFCPKLYVCCSGSIIVHAFSQDDKKRYPTTVPLLGQYELRTWYPQQQRPQATTTTTSAAESAAAEAAAALLIMVGKYYIRGPFFVEF